MVTSSDLIKLIKDKENNFTEEELKKILDAELEKNESEIDTDLVQCCLDAIEDGKKVPASKKETKKTFKFIFFAAAAAVLVFVNVIAFSKLNAKPEPSNTVLHIIDPAMTTPVIPSHTVIVEEPTRANGSELKNPDGETDALYPSLREQLHNAGFEDVSLPTELFDSEDATITVNGDTAIVSALAFEKNLNIAITKNQPAPSLTKPEGVESTTVNANGTTVLVTNEGGVSVMTYRKNSLNYQIVFISSLEEAAEIAKTIK